VKENESEIVSKVLVETPGHRFNPIIVITKGKGSGRTRILEERKQSMNQKEENLAVAITFNQLAQFYTRLMTSLKLIIN
jgi:hypothetical protein